MQVKNNKIVLNDKQLALVQSKHCVPSKNLLEQCLPSSYFRCYEASMNTQRQEMVFVFPPPAQHYLIKANFLPDNDKRLFLVRLLTARCLKSPDVLSKTCRYALLLDQEALHIYRIPPLFRANKNTRYS